MSDNDYPFPEVRERNPDTAAAHRREVLWQIILPMVLVGVVLLAGVVALGLTGVGSAGRWADISLMWLLLPVIVLSIVPLALLVGLIYGLTRALGALPGLAYQAQRALLRVERTTRRIADRAAAPVIGVESRTASWKAFWRTLRKPGLLKGPRAAPRDRRN